MNFQADENLVPMDGQRAPGQNVRKKPMDPRPRRNLDSLTLPIINGPPPSFFRNPPPQPVPAPFQEENSSDMEISDNESERELPPPRQRMGAPRPPAPRSSAPRPPPPSSTPHQSNFFSADKFIEANKKPKADTRQSREADVNYTLANSKAFLKSKGKDAFIASVKNPPPGLPQSSRSKEQEGSTGQISNVNPNAVPLKSPLPTSSPSSSGPSSSLSNVIDAATTSRPPTLDNILNSIPSSSSASSPSTPSLDPKNPWLQPGSMDSLFHTGGNVVSRCIQNKNYFTTLYQTFKGVETKNVNKVVLDNIQKTLKVLIYDNKSLCDDIQTKIGALESARKTIDECEKAWKEETEKVEGLIKKVEEKATENEELRKLQDEAKRSYDNINSLWMKAQRENNELKGRITSEQIKADESEKKMKAMKEKHKKEQEEAEKDLDKLKEKLREANKALDDAESKHSEECKRLRAQKKDADRNAANLEKDNKTLRDQLVEKDREISKLQINCKQAAINGMNDVSQELEAIRAEKVAAEKKTLELETELAQLRNQLEQNAAEASVVRANFEKIVAGNAQLQVKHDEELKRLEKEVTTRITNEVRQKASQAIEEANAKTTFAIHKNRSNERIMQAIEILSRRVENVVEVGSKRPAPVTSRKRTATTSVNSAHENRTSIDENAAKRKKPENTPPNVLQPQNPSPQLQPLQQRYANLPRIGTSNQTPPARPSGIRVEPPIVVPQPSVGPSAAAVPHRPANEYHASVNNVLNSARPNSQATATSIPHRSPSNPSTASRSRSKDSTVSIPQHNKRPMSRQGSQGNVQSRERPVTHQASEENDYAFAAALESIVAFRNFIERDKEPRRDNLTLTKVKPAAFNLKHAKIRRV